MISGKKCRLGKIIQIRLIELEKNQVWLAHEANTSTERISAYVTGRAIPSAQNIYAISKALIYSHICLYRKSRRNTGFYFCRRIENVF